MSTAKRRAISFFTALVICFSTVLFTKLDVSAESTGFHVSGTSILDANGNSFVMRGINVPHAWFTQNTSQSLAAIAATGANTVRIVLSDGEQYTKNNYNDVSNVIEMCKQNNLVCILEVHDATGKDEESYLTNAVNYWIGLKDLLNANKDYVILNIANEWYATWSAFSWRSGYVTAIKNLRAAGIENMLMVDAAGWGQYVDSIRISGKTVFNADPDKNTVFSIHMYEEAGKNESTVKSNIDKCLNIGVPVVVGEFAWKHNGVDVDEATIMSYCTQKNVGYLGWSWKGNNSDLAYLDISNDWSGKSLTTWGNDLINGTYGIRNTSKLCSVYTGESSSSGSETPVGNYISLFEGTATASSWDQAVSVMTSKNDGGNFEGSIVTSDGYFYVEYTGKLPELILQSWSGGANWVKVQAYETGSANGHSYAKYSYSSCVSAFGSNDFSGKLDQVHVGATGSSVTVYNLRYCYN
ncbi:MAG: cellulase family glycosylhydrolase [Ruminococcus sp.]|nr:cellulase family glycosylhydrolase [Ruminococcus sp.]